MRTEWHLERAGEREQSREKVLWGLVDWLIVGMGGLRDGELLCCLVVGLVG